ncbi:MAG: hypothetical protein QXI16_02840 [Sulfolobaceae archaeon]
MKKLVYFVLCVSLLLLVPSRVFAQTVSNLPDAPRALIYDDYNFVQEHERTYEYEVIYFLPYRLDKISGSINYVFVYKWQHAFSHATYNIVDSSYMLDEYILTDDGTEFYFLFTVNKNFVDTVYDGDVERIFMNDSSMYIEFEYIEPSKVMKNFLLAELYDEFAYEDTIGLEKYYVYLDAQVYLPDGTKRSITVMPDIIDDNPELFEGYDFIAVFFNLSPRARFWSPSIYPMSYISGLSYIVYDLVAGTTTFYDYQGNVFFQENSIMYIDTPQFYIPEVEAMQYREKAAYEEGKNEGYKQGREEGIRAGKRQMQEEMQQVIDNLTEYYEQELIKAYNRGKLEGANEEFDIFGYLQALFGEQGLGRLLRLELLPGVSLGAVIMIPLAFWLVSFIMRWFR